MFEASGGCPENDSAAVVALETEISAKILSITLW